MKINIKKFISVVLSTACILTLTALPTFAADIESPKITLENGLSALEEKYDVTIKKATTAKDVTTFSLEEVNNTLADLEAALIKGQNARMENQRAYEDYISQLSESGRLDNSSISSDLPTPKALRSCIHYQNIGSLVPSGTIIRCLMTGTTSLNSYGHPLWSSLVSHSSSLSSGYGTDWTETDFSYRLIDSNRTYVCEFTGTLEEPYMQSGFVQYYVYSEGWRLWFEAYSS